MEIREQTFYNWEDKIWLAWRNGTAQTEADERRKQSVKPRLWHI